MGEAITKTIRPWESFGAAASMIRFENAVHWSDTHIAVILDAVHDGERIRCLVHGEASDAAYGSDKTMRERLRAYHDHRREIEDAARRKIEGGGLERAPEPKVTWQAVILPADLTAERPPGAP